MRFRAKGEVSTGPYHVSHWFKDMEVVLVPDVNVTVPPCDSYNNQMPSHKNGTCPVTGGTKLVLGLTGNVCVRLNSVLITKKHVKTE